MISSLLYKLCCVNVCFEMTSDRIAAYKAFRKALTSAPLLLHPDYSCPFKLYVDACMDGLGAALHQVQIINDKPVEGPIFSITRKLKD